jgi:hypothetical protein
MDLNKLWVYDIETYPNVFTLAIGNMGTRKMRVFEISTFKDERKEMIQYLRDVKRSDGTMVGFNNEGFDYPVVHFILKNQDCSVMQIYNKAQRIIDSENRWENIVRDNDKLIPQIDLFLVHHFDNKARMTSLKMLEFNMKMDNIEELPYKLGTYLTDEETRNLVRYNRHDVKATAMFLEESMGELDFRVELSEKYGKNMMNYNDTKIGKSHFVDELERQNRGSCYVQQGRKRKLRQTKRDSIDLSECIFDYVKFERPEFNAILNWVKSQVIKETKGVFTDLLESDLGDVAEYARLTKKRQKKPSKPSEDKIKEYKQKHPSGWLSEEPLKSGKVSYWWNWNVAESLNVVVDGLEYVYGTGGLHASIESEIVKAEDGYIIVDQDVASYYPNLAIKNRIYPEHLSEQFCDIYEGLYEERKKYPKKTHKNINLMLKLALNGTYGASNDQYSPLYDPKFTMMITLNGQLSLCMLAEELLKIEGLTIIQCNTDGLTYKCKTQDDERAQQVCNDWEKITKLELERADYSLMAIRDVNNYLAVTTSGSVKNKGAYEWQGLGWNKNHSTPIIGRAVEECIVNGIPVEDTINNHDDPYDFMARTKVPRSSRLVLELDGMPEQQLQNICRYYVSKTGGAMTKIMPPLDKGKIVWDCIDPEGNVERVDTKQKMTVRSKREGWVVKEVELPPEERRIGINTGQKVSTCNNMNDFKGMDDINRQWYIDEAVKLVSLGVDNNETTD